MKNDKVTNISLQRLSDTVELLDNSSKQLMSVMEDQINAIITSDTQKIESLIDAHTALSWHYKENEKEFMKDLTELLNKYSNEGKDTNNIRLLKLKNVFPEWGEEIDYWHSTLSDNTRELQQKHNQVIQLLEFAMKQNAKMMHAIYSQHNEKNSRYVANGMRSDIITGVAVNQEI
ncbi:flagellar export chaperone FlgN [Gracilimonas sp. Q87]|uniref:flagellar export chaperone FlgN n=1 Tax=Gracilimonas sp. Q87 TaxID=3384766 RepID=UPI003983ED4F